jgi:hypothetical protein
MSPSNTLSKSCTAGCPTREVQSGEVDHHASDEVAAMLAVGTPLRPGRPTAIGPAG